MDKDNAASLMQVVIEALEIETRTAVWFKLLSLIPTLHCHAKQQ
jgi:hypothetical protein